MTDLNQEGLRGLEPLRGGAAPSPSLCRSTGAPVGAWPFASWAVAPPCQGGGHPPSPVPMPFGVGARRGLGAGEGAKQGAALLGGEGSERCDHGVHVLGHVRGGLDIRAHVPVEEQA